ncbi:MAG: hypothetical protein KGI10_07025 [Thaumarchaeota archaeon]|nr:hypothetical protein [Nitrososphaerota archaeon]
MNEDQFNELMKKLEILNKLVAFNIISGKKLKEQVTTLYALGIPITDIATIVGKKPTDIGQYIYRKKSKK